MQDFFDNTKTKDFMLRPRENFYLRPRQDFLFQVQDQDYWDPYYEKIL